MFPRKRCITQNVLREISLGWTAFLWQCVDKLPIEQDYLQIFELSESDGFQRIIHTQECPPYRNFSLFDKSFFSRCSCSSFVIALKYEFEMALTS